MGRYWSSGVWFVYMFLFPPLFKNTDFLKAFIFGIEQKMTLLVRFNYCQVISVQETINLSLVQTVAYQWIDLL